MAQFVNVALPIPKGQLYTYSIDGNRPVEKLIGTRVIVPFANRTMTGFIVELAEPKTDFVIKPVNEIIDEEPVFSPKMLEFTKWISVYYMAQWGETLKAALPQGLSPKTVIRIELKKIPTESEIDEMEHKAPIRAKLLRTISRRQGNISVGFLQRKTGSNAITQQLNALSEIGYINRLEEIEGYVKGKYQKALRLNDKYKAEETLQNIMMTLDKKAPRQAQALSWVILADQEDRRAFLADLINETKVSYSSVKSLIEKDIIEEYNLRVDRNLPNDDEEKLSNKNEELLTLTDEQENALNRILESIDNKSPKPILIKGITGSGKTLVYIHAIRNVINSGGSALLIVPEISLTPQMIDRFEIIFPGQVATLHSRLSEGQRYDAWHDIHRGRKRIVIGARSGVFAPLKNLKLIIVDEEHDQSFKQDSPQPRYNGRDCAIVRAKIWGATVVLGSATPSVESMYNAKNGRYELLEIKKRADGARLPDIKLIDMIHARRNRQTEGNFSKPLLTEIINRINKKEGVILLQNRRGFSSFLECPDCGYVPECSDCSVTLTYHKYNNLLICHYCGHTEKAVKSCPSCGYPDLTQAGAGTQRIEDELSNSLKYQGIKANIDRIDLDTTYKKGAHRKILSRFSTGMTDVLIGTQMVAKGLDFDRVTLVGVINADLQLNFPYFRSSELTFQLLTQVAGRAGRSGKYPGQVIIQANKIDDPAIIAARNHDYYNFYYNELQQRKDAFYPPFTRFAQIELSASDDNKLEALSNKFFEFIPNSKDIIKLGPTKPFVYKIRKRFRRFIHIKTKKTIDQTGNIQRNAIRIALEKFSNIKQNQAVTIRVDIDTYRDY